jgi:hypothetical protein
MCRVSEADIYRECSITPNAVTGDAQNLTYEHMRIGRFMADCSPLIFRNVNSEDVTSLRNPLC